MLLQKLKAIPHIVRAALNPAKAAVMITKVRRRFDSQGTLSDADYKTWLRTHGRESRAFIAETYPALAAEALAFHDQLVIDGEEALKNVPNAMGGGGVMSLLYVVTRQLQPDVVVETGVAAGYSSASFLSALEKNGKGRLFSSDFPYFRFANAEHYIGTVVPQRLRANWQLRLEGDDNNIPAILQQVDKVDIFHYDSDKSYIGRGRVMAMVAPKLAAGACIMMDDIQDNCFFHDYVKARPELKWAVVEYRGKYVGLAGRWA